MGTRYRLGSKITRGLRKKKWDNWCEQLQYLNTIKVPRCYFRDFQGNYDSIEIHCFCDASEKAFGSVIFLRFTKDEKVRTAFVTSKSRLAPIKRMTLPRLGLMVAVVEARLINRVLSVLKLDTQIYLWTDSNIVLHWVKSSFRTWKPFVSNRIVEIQNLTNPKDWRHCRGRDNPADRLTRGITIKDLENDELWWFGPSWLIKNYEVWPKEKEIKVTVDESLLKEERKGNVVPQNLCTLDSRELLIDANRFSSLLKIIRIISWIKRFIYNLRNPDKRVGNLSAEEIKESKFFLIKEVQLRSYEEEIQSLKGNRQIKKTSKIYNLCPYLDDINLLRIDSRLHQGEFSLNETNPILLPKNDRFSELLVMQEHLKLLHSGVSLTLAQLRKRFWIPQGRQFIKRIISKCLTCKKYYAKPSDQ
ncbi:reverse transcriptase [Caerostris darwini]|uniref:Reverse transcriptase n=1 Tax=Caerostris darwini TaxID=1538125 RepID=A0AAV4M7W5_9ARAC|nr:reverse transcriptase [Caerostris darwini]